jgi:hypothetical protein
MNETNSTPTPDRQQISAFINAIGGGDYSTADKHLQSVIENKLKERINNSKTVKIFNNERK